MQLRYKVSLKTIAETIDDYRGGKYRNDAACANLVDLNVNSSNITDRKKRTMFNLLTNRLEVKQNTLKPWLSLCYNA